MCDYHLNPFSAGINFRRQTLTFIDIYDIAFMMISN